MGEVEPAVPRRQDEADELAEELVQRDFRALVVGGHSTPPPPSTRPGGSRTCRSTLAPASPAAPASGGRAPRSRSPRRRRAASTSSASCPRPPASASASRYPQRRPTLASARAVPGA